MTNESGLLFDKENDIDSVLENQPDNGIKELNDLVAPFMKTRKEFYPTDKTSDYPKEFIEALEFYETARIVSDIDSVLKERGEQYGDFKDHAILSQALKNATRLNAPDYMRESMDMICYKIARIVNGNPAHIDSWRDIAGYAMLVVNELEKGGCDE
jgi:hypothetical protein